MANEYWHRHTTLTLGLAKGVTHVVLCSPGDLGWYFLLHSVWPDFLPPAAMSCSSHSMRPCVTMCTSRRCRAMATAWSSRTWRASSSPATGCSTRSPSMSPATWMAATTTRSSSCVAPWLPTESLVAPLGSSARSGLRRRIAVRELFYFCRFFSGFKEPRCWSLCDA